MNDKVQKIKKHLKKHQEAYIAGSTMLVVGAGAGLAFSQLQLIQIVDVGNIKYKSPTTTEIIQTLVRRGHPGNAILIKETGEIVASQNRAAEIMGVSPSSLVRHLQGKQESAGKFHAELLGEMPSNTKAA